MKHIYLPTPPVRIRQNKLLLALLWLVFPLTLHAQTTSTLAPGDLVILGYNSSDDQGYTGNGQSITPGSNVNDKFAFILLKDISANTRIYFTDYGWLSGGGFQPRWQAGPQNGGSGTGSAGDGILSWSTSTSLAAGTQVVIRSKYSIGASVGSVNGEEYVTDVTGTKSYPMEISDVESDQIFAYQASSARATPTLIAGMMYGRNWDTSLGATEYTPSKSTLPAALASNNLALNLPSGSTIFNDYALALYNCSTTVGFPKQLRNAINKTATWTNYQGTDGTIGFLYNQDPDFLTKVPAAWEVPIGCTFTVLKVQITGNPSNLTVCNGATATFSASAVNAETYRWQSSSNGTTWTDLSNGPQYSGASSLTLTVLNSTSAVNGLRYRVIASEPTEPSSATSLAAQLTVISPAAPTVASLTVSQTSTTGISLASQATATAGNSLEWASYSTPTTFSATAPSLVPFSMPVGKYEYFVRQKTPAPYNCISPTASLTLTLRDDTPPNTSLLSSPANPTNATTATFAFDGSDNVAVTGYDVRLDGASFAAATGTTQTYSGLTDGNHTFEVRAKDAAGNLDPTPALYTWTVDATPPNTSISTGPVSKTNSTSATFTFTGTDSGTGVNSFEYSIDGSAFTSYSGSASQTFTDLSEGNHTFEVRAIDKAGNVDPTPASFSWLVDLTPPTVAITAKPTNPTTNTTAAFSFTGTDGSGSGIARFEVSLDGGAFSTTVSPVTYTSLSIGNHSVAVRAVDAAGNVGDADTYNWTIVPPAPVISGFAATTTAVCVSQPVTFTANLTYVDAGYSYTLTNGTGTELTGYTTGLVFSQSVTSAGSGAQSFTLTITTPFGTTSNVTSVTVNVPTVINSDPTDATVCAGSTVTFTINVSGSPTPAVQWQRSTDGTNFTNVAGETQVSLVFQPTATENSYRYRAIVTNACGESLTSTSARLTVNTVTLVSTQPQNVTVCANATATFTADATGRPAPTVKWQVSNSGISFTDIDGATSLTLTVSATNALNNYQYRAMFTNSCGADVPTNAATLTVKPLPVPTLAVSGTLTCAQPTQTLMATGGTSYQFDGPGITAQNTTVGSATVNATGTYSVTVTTDGCSSTTSVIVSEDKSIPTESAAITSTQNFTTCENSGVSVVLTANCASGIYKWSDTSTGASVTIPSSATGSFPYSVSCVGANGCISSSVSATAVVKAKPTAPTLTPPVETTVCEPTTLSIAVSAVGTPSLTVTRLYMGTSSESSASGNISLSLPGSYTISGYTTLNGCQSTNATPLTNLVISPRPTPSQPITSVQSFTSYSNGPSVTLTASCASGLYKWSDNSTSASVTIPSSATGSFPYSVSCVSASGCLSSGVSATAIIVPNRPPVLNAPFAPVSTTVGENFRYQIAANAFTDPENGALTYSISGQPNWPGLTITGRAISGSVTTAGNFTVTITATDSYGASASGPLEVSVSPLPSGFYMLPPFYNCQTGQFTFRTSGGDKTPIQYMADGITPWSTNPNQIAGAALRANPKTITIYARQRGVTISRVVDLSAYCNSLPTARVAATTAEPEIPLTLTVQGNPVTDGLLKAEVRGAEGRPLRVEVTNLNGRAIATQFIESAGAIQQVRIPVTNQPSGLLLLRVNTATQSQIQKIIKQ